MYHLVLQNYYKSDCKLKYIDQLAEVDGQPTIHHSDQGLLI